MTLQLDHRTDGVLVLTLSDPARRNPIGHALRQRLTEALSEAESDDHVTAVVLTGAGGHFSAGGDIRDQQPRSLAAHRERFATIKDLVGRMVRFSKPLVAAVDGWAAGGGFGLALACPTVVASDRARFVASFTRIGLIPDMGLLASLPARIGPVRARRLILDNRRVDAAEALDLGIVDQLVPADGLLAAASACALQEAATAPMVRQLVNDWFAREIGAALDYEQQLQPLLLNSADAAEGRAAFREKRTPRFRGC
ncbi:enoyl-CoA hydratase/isomerase family protein [Paracoccus sp. S1E-3]|uniref:enoyl-CoA hydratase/isomerase family protein n=1 Tax=Paracoccus sp. S1E-3 TaxID=2756130 RepID=UPI0015EF4D2B|nr:enoyl-CoA hydratase/isomerase family protein [Paracoccus sp. S1E-3]MBA4490053.1 enoyl-CoA hydratase/isomerase family protein [Paracoccus sp. S1E-3]